MAPSTASVTFDHLVGCLERHLRAQISQRIIQNDAEAQCVRNFVNSFRRIFEVDLATPRNNLSLDTPGFQAMSSLNPFTDSDSSQIVSTIPPQSQMQLDMWETQGCTNFQSDVHCSSNQNPNAVNLHSSPAGENFSKSGQREYYPHADCVQDSHEEEDISVTPGFVFESLPDNGIFSLDVIPNDYDFHIPRAHDLEPDGYLFDFDTGDAVTPLSDIIESEINNLPDSFLDVDLKTKHHGNLQLQQP